MATQEGEFVLRIRLFHNGILKTHLRALSLRKEELNCTNLVTRLQITEREAVRIIPSQFIATVKV